MNGFEDLATYNAEVARGIVHTPEYAAKMAVRQDDFERAQEARLRDEGWVPMEECPGVWRRA